MLSKYSLTIEIFNFFISKIVKFLWNTKIEVKNIPLNLQ